MMDLGTRHDDDLASGPGAGPAPEPERPRVSYPKFSVHGGVKEAMEKELGPMKRGDRMMALCDLEVSGTSENEYEASLEFSVCGLKASDDVAEGQPKAEKGMR